jgi:aldose 1-epimerase
MAITQRALRADDVTAEAFTLTNTHGLEAEILTFGATLRALRVPDRAGQLADVLHGFNDLEPYVGPHPYFGSLVGRYGNRIKAGRFSLGGRSYQLAINNGPNHLHGGPGGFHRALWAAQPLEAPDGPSLTLAYLSPDGEEGYPGALAVVVTYTLTARNELRIDYEARTDRETVLNLTSHGYFNLAGGGDIRGHELQVVASRYLPVDPTAIPLGELRPVAGTPFDFRHPAPLGPRLDADDEQLRQARGFDHCYALDKAPGDLALAAVLSDPASGRSMELYTTQPGLQLYTGNFLDGSIIGKGGRPYGPYSAVCLETQHFPDAPNQPTFPSTVLRPGEHYRHTTVHRMLTRET